MPRTPAPPAPSAAPRGQARTPAVEVAVQSPGGARTAHDAGAARVELCAALGATGGLTPGRGLLDLTLEVGIPVHVLVRPRGGGFVHDPDEADVLVAEVRAAVSAGAAGVVVGVLTPERLIDTGLMARLVDSAAGREVTFHRAFDVVADRRAALDVLVTHGVRRVLTSGGAARAADALEELPRLVSWADGRIEVMAGGGVRPEDVRPLAATGVDAVHLSARTAGRATGAAGPGGGQETVAEATDPVLVRAAVDAALAASPPVAG